MAPRADERLHSSVELHFVVRVVSVCTIETAGPHRKGQTFAFRGIRRLIEIALIAKTKRQKQSRRKVVEHRAALQNEPTLIGAGGRNHGLRFAGDRLLRSDIALSPYFAPMYLAEPKPSKPAAVNRLSEVDCGSPLISEVKTRTRQGGRPPWSKKTEKAVSYAELLRISCCKPELGCVLYPLGGGTLMIERSRLNWIAEPRPAPLELRDALAILLATTIVAVVALAFLG